LTTAATSTKWITRPGYPLRATHGCRTIVERGGLDSAGDAHAANESKVSSILSPMPDESGLGSADGVVLQAAPEPATEGFVTAIAAHGHFERPVDAFAA
jgi:hypothetical protein